MPEPVLSICIWCGSLAKSSLEHIFPEALGCPLIFVLTEGVCVICNNGLAHLDQALLHEFEMPAFMAGIPRKKGKPPVIRTWVGLAAAVGPEGPEIHLNAGPQSMTAMGKTLSAAKASTGLKNIQFETEGLVGKVKFDQEIGRDPKFTRALFKVALGSVAFHLGLEEARHAKYDALRDFVRTGNGVFEALLIHECGPEGHNFPGPLTKPGRPHPVVPLVIFGLNFLLDLDPEQKCAAEMRAEAERLMGCTMYPIKKCT